MKVEIFGKGCRNCERLEENVKQASAELGLEIELSKITDPLQMAERSVFKTPGLAIKGKVVMSGRVPTTEKVRELFQEVM